MKLPLYHCSLDHTPHSRLWVDGCGSGLWVRECGWYACACWQSMDGGNSAGRGSFASPFLQTRRVVLIPCLVHLWGDVPITLHPSAISHGETRHLLSSVQWDSRRQNLPGNYKYLARPVSAIYSCLIWFIITECGGRFARKFSSFRGVSKRYNLTSPWLWWVGLECSHLYTQRNKVASGSPQCLQHRSG